MAYSYEKIIIGPLFVPKYTESDIILEKELKKYGDHYSFRNHFKLFDDFTIHPSISFNINILASLILKEVIFFLMNRLDYVLSYNTEAIFFPLSMMTYYKNLSEINNQF